MKNIICLIIVLVFSSCDSDPIQMNLDQGVEFEQHIFKLDDILETSQNSFEIINTGKSNLLLSGYIVDSLRNDDIVMDTVKSLITLDLSKFFEYEYEICTSVVHVDLPTISLFSPMTLSDILPSENFKISLLDTINLTAEDDAHWDDFGKHILGQHMGEHILEYTVLDTSENEIIITLPTTFLKEDSTAIICDANSLGLSFVSTEATILMNLGFFLFG